MTALPKQEDNLLHFNKGKKMADKFEKGYVMSSQLYRKEVYPFLSDAARHVYFELENKINGFQKDSDFVSYSQLQGNSELEGARTVSRMTIAKGIKELANHGVITILATHPKLGNKYQINEVSLLGKQYTKSTSTPTVPVHVVYQSSTPTVPQVVHVVDPQKKDLKIFTKESSSEGKPQFKVQENVIAGYVTYFMNDAKYYSLFELESLYSVDVDFVNQALASYPSLTLKIDNFSEMFNEMRQWSLTANAGKKQPQQWMNTWLTWVKNNAHKFNEKPKQSAYQPRAKAQPTPRIGSNKRKAEKTVNPIVLEVRDV